jgi:hypothetical protein
MNKKISFFALGFIVLISTFVFAQDQMILVPKAINWTPYVVSDTGDLFGKAWRFYREGYTIAASDSLKKLVALTGFHLKKNNYYIVVANFTASETPIGMFHGDAAFHDTRLYGLKSDSLYYIFISRDDSAKSYISALATRKGSHFEENLVHFISLFPIFSQVRSQVVGENRTWIDIRKFEVPKKMQENCDLNVIVKKDFIDETFLARAIFDNTSLEKWSFGIASAVTTVDDIDFVIDNGSIIVRPKPTGDLANFGVINYYFKPVDTKARLIAPAFHLLGGLRVARVIEPIIGAGLGIPVSAIELHLFVGFSLEFAQKLASGYDVNDLVTKAEDPFKLKLRGKPRIGIEVSFP